MRVCGLATDRNRDQRPPFPLTVEPSARVASEAACICWPVRSRELLLSVCLRDTRALPSPCEDAPGRTRQAWQIEAEAEPGSVPVVRTLWTVGEEDAVEGAGRLGVMSEVEGRPVEEACKEAVSTAFLSARYPGNFLASPPAGQSTPQHEHLETPSWNAHRYRLYPCKSWQILEP